MQSQLLKTRNRPVEAFKYSKGTGYYLHSGSLTDLEKYLRSKNPPKRHLTGTHLLSSLGIHVEQTIPKTHVGQSKFRIVSMCETWFTNSNFGKPRSAHMFLEPLHSTMSLSIHDLLTYILC